MLAGVVGGSVGRDVLCLGAFSDTSCLCMCACVWTNEKFKGRWKKEVATEIVAYLKKKKKEKIGEYLLSLSLSSSLFLLLLLLFLLLLS